MIPRLARLFWLLCACCVAFPLSAAAAGLLAADLDGDGRNDYVVTDRHHPHVLRVWFSASDTTQIIRTKARAQQIAAADLDGDRKPELIWRDGVKLHVLKRAEGKFKRVRARHVAPQSHTPRETPNANDRDTDLPAATSVGTSDVAAPPHAFVYPPPAAVLLSSHAERAASVRERRSILEFVPRPPPASTPL